MNGSSSHPPAEAPGPDMTRDATTEDDAMTRSEERLRAGTVTVVTGRARLVTTVVVEEQTFTIPVRRQEIRLVQEPLPTHKQVITDTAPAEEIYEVVRYAEQVLFTTEVVPVERVCLIKHVVTTRETVTGQVRSEQIAVEQTDDGRTTAPPAPTPRLGDTPWA